MNILVLNGSPRPNGNTHSLIESFKKGAESSNHNVKVINVCNQKIHACTGCAYCRNEGLSKCVFDDDMIDIINNSNHADLIVFASPIYYWGLTGQLQSTISRFYSTRRPNCKKYALILTSDSNGAFDAVLQQFSNIAQYFQGEIIGTITSFGTQNKSEQKLQESFDFGKNI